MSARDHLNPAQGFPKTGNEGLDRAAREGSSMPANSAAIQDQTWQKTYDRIHPRPKSAVNVTPSGA